MSSSRSASSGEFSAILLDISLLTANCASGLSRVAGCTYRHTRRPAGPGRRQTAPAYAQGKTDYRQTGCRRANAQLRPKTYGLHRRIPLNDSYDGGDDSPDDAGADGDGQPVAGGWEATVCCGGVLRSSLTVCRIRSPAPSITCRMAASPAVLGSLLPILQGAPGVGMMARGVVIGILASGVAVWYKGAPSCAGCVICE